MRKDGAYPVASNDAVRVMWAQKSTPGKDLNKRVKDPTRQVYAEAVNSIASRVQQHAESA